MNIDITSDINRAMRDIDDTFWTQIPFTLVSAMNDTMFDAKERVTGPTYDKAFEKRNTSAPKNSWFINKAVTGGKNAAAFKTFKANGGTIEVILQQRALRGRGGRSNFLEYYEKHVTGGTKTPTGSRGIAIPTSRAEGYRNPQGSMRKTRKPQALRDKKNFFVKGRGSKRVIMERTKEGLVPWYILVPQAQIDRRFRFYEDGIDTIERVFSGHFVARMNRVIRRSRFT